MRIEGLSLFVSLVLLCLPALVARAQRRPVKTAAPTPVVAVTPAAADPAREIDKLFSHGEDAARDRQAHSLAERALAADAGNYQLLWRRARSAYYVGDEAPAGEKLGYFEGGVQAAQKAIQLNPNGVEGHFWLGVCYGGIAEVRSALRALSIVKKIRAEMETVLRLHDHYEDGSAYLALGQMDTELPRLFGGSTTRAISYLEKGLAVAPKNTGIRLALAEAYRDAGRREDARRQLDEILQMPVNPARAKEQRSVQDKARRLLGKV
ncbi:MAG: TRAP transporter TatT component family protein [Blastocatellia bacterium]